MKKRILAAFLALVMVVSGIYFVKPDTEEVKAAGTVANAEVPTEMLGVKMQAKVHDKGTVNDPTDDTMDLRILSSVDSLDYKEVGFYVWYDAAAKAPTDTNRTAHFKTTTVFKRIGATSKVAYKFSPKMIDTCAEYFISGTIMGIKYDNWGKDFYIQAYCVTNDNQTVTGVGRYFNVADASSKTVINIPIAMPADGITVGSTTKVTVGDTLTDATVEAYLDGHAHLNVQVADKTKLPSASKVEHVIIPEGGEVEYLATGNKAIYRNVESELKVTTEGNTVTVTGDTSWYKAYEGENEFVIANAADLYGFAQADTNFAGKTIYMIADIDGNDYKGAATAGGFTRSDGKTPYPWAPIGLNYGHDLNFAGTFDGEQHTISGLYNSLTGVYTGGFALFGTTGLCTIRDFNLANTYFKLEGITNNSNLAGVAGVSTGIFDTIKVENDVYLVHGVGTKEDYTGGIVGMMGGTGETGSKISNCQFSGTIIANDYVGGILGLATDGDSTTAPTKHQKTVEIEHCLNNGKFVFNANSNCFGGLCGTVSFAQLEITDSVNVATIDSSGYTVNNLTTGSLIGWIRNNYLNLAATTDGTENTYTAIIENSYGVSGGNWKSLGYRNSKGHTKIDGTVSAGSGKLDNAKVYLSAANLTGETGYLNTNLDYSVGEAYSGYWTATTGTPVLSSFLDAEEVLQVSEITTPRTAWYVEGTYADTDMYTLYTKADMYGFASLTDVDFAEKTVKLGADITLNEGQATPTGFTPATESTTLIQWTPKYMAGTFDGDGHTIRGLYLNTDKGNAGLFASVTGTVKDFRLLNSYIKCIDQTAKDYASTNYLYGTGSIAGSLNGTMDTVYSDAIVYHDRAYAGGLVGTVYGTGTNVITNSCFAGRITARNAVAGIAGMVINTSVNVEHCLNVGTIATTDSVIGALVGYIRVTDGDSSHVFSMDDCLNVGRRDVTTEGTSTQAWAAGIIGFTGGTTVDTAYVNNTFYIRNYADENDTWVRFNYGTIGYKNVASTINFNTYNPMTELAVLQHRIGLSFQVEGEDNSQNYWVARDGKIPMLESFEDLLTNVTY